MAVISLMIQGPGVYTINFSAERFIKFSIIIEGATVKVSQFILGLK
jgi:hypothetical protein